MLRKSRPTSRQSRPPRRLRLSRRATILTATLLVVLVAGVPSVGYAAYSSATAPAFLEGTTIGSVNVSDMSRGAARSAVRGRISDRLERTATVRVGKQSYSTTPKQLGASADVQAAVDRAFRRAENASWWARLRGNVSAPALSVPVKDPATKQVGKLVKKMVRQSRVSARDASLELSGGSPDITSERVGRRLAPKEAREALQQALDEGGVQAAQLKKIQPEVTAEAFSTIIVVDDGSNELRLYDDGELVQTYNVATGKKGHRTPHGRFEVTRKRPHPTWVNPAPKGWGKKMPKKVKPGPKNPLGLRALNLSAPGIRIHGTAKGKTVGRDASHGCIRLHNKKVVELYPQVPEGATVFITA